MDQTTLAVDGPPETFEPVEFEIRAACPEYVMKPCGTCGKPKSNKLHRKKNEAEGLPFCKFKRQNGCADCGKAKSHDDHFGAPPSFNIFAGTDPNTYRNMMETWKSVLLDHLRLIMPERQFSAIQVEGEATFPKARERDQGNFRTLIEKALGDALESGGWIEKDTWDHYEFGGLTQKTIDGVSATRLILFLRV